MQKKDIIINDDESNFKFNFRVAGIFVNDSKILFQKCEKDNYYSLIGGRVKYGETTIEALIREIQEEIGIKVNKKEIKLINVSENFFKYNGKEFHELLFIYKINNKQIDQISEIKTLDKTNVVNKWYDISKLNVMDVRPNIITNLIENNKIVHYIIK